MTQIERITAGISQLLMLIAAGWMFLIALLVLADVLARGVFNSPILGIPELIANSIVSIAFLQLPLTVRIRAMLRAEIIDGLVGRYGRKWLAVFGLLLGAALFGMISVASWDPMLVSWASGEYEGEGGMRVPVYPVRTIIVFCSFLAAVNYLLNVWDELVNRPTSAQASVPG